MADVVDAATRSRMMSGIRSKNTAPEIVVRQLLHAKGFRFRLHDRKLPGTPDIVLAKYRAAIFVSGCFWHGHDCRLFRLPATRTEFWLTKIERNRSNDERSRQRLLAAGWRHCVVWECAVRGQAPAAHSTLAGYMAQWLGSTTGEAVFRGER